MHLKLCSCSCAWFRKPILDLACMPDLITHTLMLT
jgi:hypothetical protein